MTAFAFIGFGELGVVFAERLVREASNAITVYVPQRDDAAARAAVASRLGRAGATRSETLADAIAAADVVLSVVPARVSLQVAQEAAPLLRAGAYFVDFAPAAPADKQAASALVAERGARYVDVGVLGTVSTSGYEVPLVLSGDGAAGFGELAAAEGLEVDVLDAPAGHATLLKLLRSVYLKGRDALIVEMMLAARRYGLEERVAESVRGPGETVPFPALADRVLRALAVHADRRADELLACSEVVAAAGVDPLGSSAASAVLRGVAALGLREAFEQQRPSSGADVLAAIDARSGQAAPRER
jgi:3-hydroxyisobutyrate dehydrogenase-like beta-hydroxyacid dehydrogenase